MDDKEKDSIFENLGVQSLARCWLCLLFLISFFSSDLPSSLEDYNFSFWSPDVPK